MRRGRRSLWRIGHSLPLPIFDMHVKLWGVSCRFLHIVYPSCFQLVDKVALPCCTVTKRWFGSGKKLCREGSEHERCGTTTPCSSRGSADMSWPLTAWKSTVLCFWIQCFLGTFNTKFHASFWCWIKPEESRISYRRDMMVFSHLGEG